MRRPTPHEILLIVAAAAPALLAAADTGPELRRGRWRFERTFEYADGRPPGAPIVAERCGDPEESTHKAAETLRRMGCGYERERSAPDTWTLRLTCDKPGVPKGTSTSVMRVAGTESYAVEIVNEGEMATPVVREHLTAKRLGDC